MVEKIIGRILFTLLFGYIGITFVALAVSAILMRMQG